MPVDKIKNIVEHGLFNGYSYNNIITRIAFEIADKEELLLLEIWSDISEISNLKERAEILYNKYREEYYNSMK